MDVLRLGVSFRAGRDRDPGERQRRCVYANGNACLRRVCGETLSGRDRAKERQKTDAARGDRDRRQSGEAASPVLGERTALRMDLRRRGHTQPPVPHGATPAHTVRRHPPPSRFATPLCVRNRARLPVAFVTACPSPFRCSIERCRLQPDEDVLLCLNFDPAVIDTLHSTQHAAKLEIRYEQIDRVETVKLIGEIRRPNLAFHPANVTSLIPNVL